MQPTLINLHPNEYSRKLHYYPFAVGILLSNKVCVLNKTENLNIHAFNKITGKNRSKILIKDISWECKRKFYGRKCNSNQKWNNDKCRCDFKNPIYVKKIIFRILLHVVVKIENISQILLTIQWLRAIKL